MSQRYGKDYVRFDKGLVTEANPLTPVPNTFSDALNVEVGDVGEITQRRALRFINACDIPHRFGNDVDTFVWNNAGGSSTTRFFVVRTGEYLRVYSWADGVELSAVVDDSPVYSLNLDTQLTETKEADWNTAQFSMTEIKGDLVFVSGTIDPHHLAYDNDADTFTLSNLQLVERDLWGNPDDPYFNLDALGEYPRPSTSEADGAYLYNLNNQGWTVQKLAGFKTHQSASPSASDIPTFGVYTDSSGKKAFDGNQFDKDKIDFGNTPAPKGHVIQSVFGGTGSDVNYPYVITQSQVYSDGANPYTELTFTVADTTGLSVSDTVTVYSLTAGTKLGAEIVNGGNKGRLYVVANDVLTITAVPSSTTFRATATGSTGSTSYDGADSFPIATGIWDGSYTGSGTIYTQVASSSPEATDARPTVVASYAGRLFYSGLNLEGESNNPRYLDAIWYSQTIKNNPVIEGKTCHQLNDPTSEDLNEVIDTDGGKITIESMGTAHTLLQYQSSLLVFSDRGVWEISGGEGLFSPSNTSIRQVSNLTPIKGSVIKTDATVMFWSSEGIYGIGSDDISGYLTAKPVSVGVIDTFYLGLTKDVKDAVISVYDDNEKKAYWFYSSQSARPTDRDSWLTLNLRTGAFTTHQLGSNEDRTNITAAAISEDSNNADKRLVVLGNYELTVDTNNLLEQDSTSINLEDGSALNLQEDVVVIPETSLCSSEFTGLDTNDEFPDSTGTTTSTESFNAYLQVDYEFMSGGSVKKTAPMAFIYLQAGVNEAVGMQARYDFSNSGNSGKWSTVRTVDGNVPNRETAIRKVRFRGVGYNVSYKFTNIDGKKFTVYGWSAVGSTRQQP